MAVAQSNNLLMSQPQTATASTGDEWTPRRGWGGNGVGMERAAHSLQHLPQHLCHPKPPASPALLSKSQHDGFKGSKTKQPCQPLPSSALPPPHRNALTSCTGASTRMRGAHPAHTAFAGVKHTRKKAKLLLGWRSTGRCTRCDASSPRTSQV